jgi:chromosome partitioning protein
MGADKAGIVAIVNQKGGVGKTTVTLGLASAAASVGRRVLVVDLDPQAASTWVLGIDPEDRPTGVIDAMRSGDAAPFVSPSAWCENVDVLAGARKLQRKERGDPDLLARALTTVRGRYDAILVDCPPSLGNLTANALVAATHAIIVVEPSTLGLRGIGAVADLVDEVWDEHNPHLDLAGVIVNRVPAVSAEASRRLVELADIVGAEAIWQPLLPQRVIVPQSAADRRPLHSYGTRSADVAAAFDALWWRLRAALATRRD